MAVRTRIAARAAGAPSERAGAGRHRVMDTALHMFLQRGYRGTSMKALAAELGMSAPAIYWYFPSKEDLYISVIEKAMQNFVVYVQEEITASDPLGQLTQLVRAHVTWQLQQSDVARAFDLTVSTKSLGHDIPASRLDRIKSMEVQYVQNLRRMLADGQQQGLMRVSDVASTAFAIITLCEYVHTWYMPGGRLSVAEVAGDYVRMVRNLVEA